MNQITPYTYTIADAAKKTGLLPGELFSILRKRKAIDSNNQPAPRLVRQGYMRQHTSFYAHSVLGMRERTSARLTTAGIVWLQTLLAEEHSQCSST